MFCTFANLCLEILVLEGGTRLLNTVFVGDIWNRRALATAIFLHWRSFIPPGTAFARINICRLRRSLGVDMINFLKEESGGLLVNC
jgi:hypothetical protein